MRIGFFDVESWEKDILKIVTNLVLETTLILRLVMMITMVAMPFFLKKLESKQYETRQKRRLVFDY